MVYSLSKLLAVILPPVLGWLFVWVWRVNGHPLWVGLTVGGVGMLAAFAAGPIALLAAATHDDNHKGIRRALAPLIVIWFSGGIGIGMALLTAFLVGMFRGAA